MTMEPPALTTSGASSPKEMAEVIYKNLRHNCMELEELIEYAEKMGGLDAKALKRLDKAVTVMKVGFKIMKKATKKKPATTSVVSMNAATCQHRKVYRP